MMNNDKQARQAVLTWYDQYGRDLPWRLKGARQDAYKVWLSEIMLQQTTVQAVKPYYHKFLSLWPTIHDLAQAENDAVMQAWAGLGYYSRARNLLACARVIVDQYEGVFPDNERDLKALPGIGDYTAAAILSIAFNTPSVVVDGNIERITARLYDDKTPMPALKAAVKKNIAGMMKVADGRQSDFVQALMDIGSSICTPKSPQCSSCPLQANCHTQEPETLPVRAQKKALPHRVGQVFIIRDGQGRIALEKRNSKIMLGDMWGLPSTQWHNKTAPGDHTYMIERSTDTQRVVRHIFSHFSLDLHIMDHVHMAGLHPDWLFVSLEELQTMGLPSLYQKVVKLIEPQEP